MFCRIAGRAERVSRDHSAFFHRRSKKTRTSKIPEIHTFQFSVSIPENWELCPEPLTKYDCVPPTGYETGEKDGNLLDYAFRDVYEMQPNVPREQHYQVTYALARLGSIINYQGCRPVATSAFYKSGICHQGYISSDAAGESGGRMPDALWRYNRDAMAFMTQRGVFVIFAADDGETTEEEITKIAQSAAFSGDLPSPEAAPPQTKASSQEGDGLLQMDFSRLDENLENMPGGIVKRR